MLAARGTVAGKVASGVFVRLSLVAAWTTMGNPALLLRLFLWDKILTKLIQIDEYYIKID
jgi:hypothetical protein